MKTCLFRAGWVVSVLFVGSCGIGHAAGPIVAYSDRSELSGEKLLLPVGTPRDFFLEKMGPPDVWLSPHVGVYWNRRTNQPQLTRDYDTVLVQFSQDRVSSMKIVPGIAIREFLVQREKGNSAAMVVAVNPPPARGK
jgi:hypothetical protein